MYEDRRRFSLRASISNRSVGTSWIPRPTVFHLYNVRACVLRGDTPAVGFPNIITHSAKSTKMTRFLEFHSYVIAANVGQGGIRKSPTTARSPDERVSRVLTS